MKGKKACQMADGGTSRLPPSRGNLAPPAAPPALGFLLLRWPAGAWHRGPLLSGLSAVPDLDTGSPLGKVENL